MVALLRQTTFHAQVRKQLRIAVSEGLHVFQMAFACSSTTLQLTQAHVRKRSGRFQNASMDA